MEPVVVTFRLVSALSPLTLPLLLGVLVYFRLREYQHSIAHLVGFLVPPILSFYFLRMVVIADMARMRAEYGRSTCGMAALAEAIAVLTGIGIQILFSVVAQIVLHGREQTSSASE